MRHTFNSSMARLRSSTSSLHKRAARLVRFAALLVLVSVSNVGATDLVAGRQLAKQLACFECHGTDGISVDAKTPNLAGQDESYLMRQLQNFAEPEVQELQRPTDFERNHRGMEATTRNLTYRQMGDLAAYFSSLGCSLRSLSEAAPAAAKPCARCHGPFGVNIDPGIPDLSGQKAGYLRRQLQAFRASRFGADPASAGQERYQETMATHAVRLTDEEIDTIAAYFAGLACR